MTGSRTRYLNAIGLLLLVSVLGCQAGCSSGFKGYMITLTVRGSADAFLDTTVVVDGVTLGAARKSPNASSMETVTSFCTYDWDQFLNKPFEFVVQTKGMTVESTVDRVACKFSKDPESLGFETTTVALEEDGRVTGDFGGDPRVFTSCNPRYGGCAPANF